MKIEGFLCEQCEEYNSGNPITLIDFAEEIICFCSYECLINYLKEKKI